MTYLQAFIIAIIEGLTEFLPVSSTGHMILADSLMKIQDPEFAKTFEIVIQLGAIMAVLFIYIKRFFVSINIYIKLLVAFLPTGIIGLLAYKTIKQYLFNPFTVSISLIVGGIILILLDKWSERKKSEYAQVENISYSSALKIGFIQCFSMVCQGFHVQQPPYLEEFSQVLTGNRPLNFLFCWPYLPCLLHPVTIC